MISSSDILHGKVLIVDDLEVDVLLLERMLRSAGYISITSTMDPGEVCELHLKNRYDLILLDLLMPGMDGFQVMEGLKGIEKYSYLSVLVITAQPDHKLRALKTGAKDFISKPFEQAEVLARVHNLLEVRLLHEATRNYGKMQESLALHDPLTGLANRRLLTDRMSMALVHARRNKRMMAVMYLDLDGFKQINDTLGHDAGDTLLRQLAARLLAAVRQGDTVARLGGDEFVIVLLELSHADAVTKLASKVIQAVSQPYIIQNRSLSITVSIGISIYPTHGEEVETLMKSADLVLYNAKRAGKNAYRISVCTDLSAIARSQHDPLSFSTPLPDASEKMKDDQ